MLGERCEAWRKPHDSDLWRDNNNNGGHYAWDVSQALDGGRHYNPSEAPHAWELYRTMSEEDKLP